MSNEKQCECKKTSIGGQALMEGIMMRGPKLTAMAVRNPEGEIVIEKFPTESVARNKFCKLPLIRGIFGYIDSMKFGSKCLMRSAEISGLDQAEEEMKQEKAEKRAKKAAKNPKKAEKYAKKQAKESEKLEKKKNELEVIAQKAEQESEQAAAIAQIAKEKSEAQADNKQLKAEAEKAQRNAQKAKAAAEKARENVKHPENSSLLMGAIMTVSMVLGVALAIGLFVVLPTFIYNFASKHLAFLAPENAISRSFIKSVFEGILKIMILIGYMGAVSLMKDIRRTFMFHGAEHMTIFCYEAGLELTVENVRKQKRFHPRCGTSFLILMVIVSIFISFLIDPLFLLTLGYIPHTIFRVIIKLLLLPLIVGLGYECIKLAGRYDNVFTKIISAPGVWLQHITVFKPTDDMIECAIAAISEVIPDDDSDKW